MSVGASIITMVLWVVIKGNANSDATLQYSASVYFGYSFWLLLVGWIFVLIASAASMRK